MFLNNCNSSRLTVEKTIVHSSLKVLKRSRFAVRLVRLAVRLATRAGARLEGRRALNWVTLPRQGTTGSPYRDDQFGSESDENPNILHPQSRSGIRLQNFQTRNWSPLSSACWIFSNSVGYCTLSSDPEVWQFNRAIRQLVIGRSTHDASVCALFGPRKGK